MMMVIVMVIIHWPNSYVHLFFPSQLVRASPTSDILDVSDAIGLGTFAYFASSPIFIVR